MRTRGAVAIEYLFLLAIEMMLLTALLLVVFVQYRGGTLATFMSSLMGNRDKIGSLIDGLISTGSIGETRSILLYHQAPPEVSDMMIVVENNSVGYVFTYRATRFRDPSFFYSPPGGVLVIPENSPSIGAGAVVLIRATKTRENGAVAIKVGFEVL